MSGLNYLAGTTESRANGISGDGKVSVGNSGSTAVKWDEAGAVTSLGIQGKANAANLDGSIIVGQGNRTAFRWTAATGATTLGTLGGNSSEAKDITSDGSVIVGGAAITGGNNHAFRWTAATGMVDLGVLSGQTSSVANSVSDDGNIIVGSSGTRAFIWTPDALQDLANLQLSQITSADTLGHLTASQNRRTRDLTTQQCLPSGKQTYCLSGGVRAYSGEGEGSGKQASIQVMGGVRVAEQVTLGASAHVGRANLHTAAAEQRNAYGLAVWAAYQQQPSALGWNGNASVALGHSDNSLQRGAQLLDVQRAEGRTQLNSTALRVAAGYGLQYGSSLLTPELALSLVSTTSASFTEYNTAFPLTLKSSNSRETYATLGLRSATPLTPKTTLNLGMAVDTLLHDDTDPVEGRSNVPGLTRFQLRSSLDKRTFVPMATAGLTYALSPNASLAGQVQAGASTYEQQNAVYGVGLEYRYAF